MKDFVLEKRKRDERPFFHARYGALPGKRSSFPRVTLVMPVGGADLPMTRASVVTLYQNTAYPNWDVVFIDDASKGGIHEYLAAVPGSVLITNTTRHSFAHNTNNGIKAVESDYYILFNNDVLVFDPYWLHKMVAVAESDEKIGVVGGGFNSCGSFWWQDGNGTAQAWHYNQVKFFGKRPFECQSVGGFNMMIKAEVIRRIGLLDEGFKPAYGEETDFCFRAVARGYRVMDTYIRVYHISKGGFRETLGHDKISAALGGSSRRLALRWGAALPLRAPATYGDAIRHLRWISANGDLLLQAQPELPPTLMDDGQVNPLFVTRVPSSKGAGAFLSRLGSNFWTQAARAWKIAIWFRYGQYNAEQWKS